MDPPAVGAHDSPIAYGRSPGVSKCCGDDGQRGRLLHYFLDHRLETRSIKLGMACQGQKGGQELYFALIRVPAFADGITIFAGSACQLNWGTGRSESAWHAAVFLQSRALLFPLCRNLF